MNQISRILSRSPAHILPFLLLLSLGIILVLFVFQVYVLLVNYNEGSASMPVNFGNHPHIIKTLTDQARRDSFRFVVVGDTKSVGTFERIAEQLRRGKFDFAVLLGDVSFMGKESYHRHLRAELHETNFGLPTFYVVGNHDVDPDTFPIHRFEEIYGPSIFLFEYHDCLFIFLRVLDKPYSNRESIDFLANQLSRPMEKYRYRFVFMHIPPSISPDFRARRINGGLELVSLLIKLDIDYVFCGDFHGYARTRYGDLTFLVTGGGGGNLKGEDQFHHATVVTVGWNFISERLIKVDKSVDVEDVLEKHAIGDVYPWILENRAGVLGGNIGLLIVMLGLIRALRKIRRDSSRREIIRISA